MRYLRAVLILLVVAAGVASTSMAVGSDAANGPACMQSAPDQDRGCGGDVMSAACGAGCVACALPAITGAAIVVAGRPDRGGVTMSPATSVSSVARAPEKAPPRHSIF